MYRSFGLLVALVFALLFACQPADPQQDQTELGQLGYTFSGNTDALPHFEEGLLFLHSFEYEDAREAFQLAVEADPNMPMAYWGEAMSYYKALWGREDVEQARAALEGLGASPEARLSKTEDPLEQGFLKSLDVLLGEGSKDERHKAYSKAMEALYSAHPQNQEVAAFYSLSLLWIDEAEANEKSARVVQSVLEENPSHPGALHYTIHAYDNPESAPKALNAANAYGTVAPAAAHALHMPSHIYVAVGMWDEVVASNERAYAASVDRMERKGLSNDARDLHSFQWLMYGYLQQGRYKEAKVLMKEMIDLYPTLERRNYANEYIARMQGAYFIESGDWENKAIAQAPFDGSSVSINMNAMYAYPSGYLAFLAKDETGLGRIRAELEEAIGKAEVLVSDGGPAMCSAPGLSRYAPTENGVRSAKVVLAELKSLEARLKGNVKQAEEQMQRAVSLEEETNYSYGPPQVLKPSFELYGEWLLEQGRAEEAIQQFDKALERAPKRVAALLGKMKALEIQGDTAQADQIREELKVIWKKADPDVRQSLGENQLKTQNS